MPFFIYYKSLLSQSLHAYYSKIDYPERLRRMLINPVAIIKKQLKLEQGLCTILQIVSLMPFEKMPLLQALTDVETIEHESSTNN
jgi:hypothetical protein